MKKPGANRARMVGLLTAEQPLREAINGSPEAAAIRKESMPVELQLIRASEFVRLDPRAHLDFAASKKALQTLAEGCQKRGVHCALLDLRPLPVLEKPLFTPSQLAALVSCFREAGFSRQERLAVLYTQDTHRGIRNFAFISRMRGLKVEAFTEFETAFHWLSAGPGDGEYQRQEEIPVPIGQRRMAKKVRIDSTTRKTL